MALLKLDSLSHWDHNDPNYKWPVVSSRNAINVSASHGRNGAGIRIVSGGTEVGSIPGLDATVADFSSHGMLEEVFINENPSSTWAAGFAFKFSDIALEANIPLFALLDTGYTPYPDALGFFYPTQSAVHFCPDQKLRLCYGEYYSPTVVHTVPFVLKRGVWYYLEFLIGIGDPGGTFQCRIDGKPISNEGSLKTQTTTNNSADGVRIFHHKSTVGGQRNARTFYVDDIYVASGFYSDIEVECIRPTADGANDQWTPSSGADNYAMVDDLQPDENTTYNTATAAGNIDTYEHGDLDHAAGTIYGLAIQMGVLNNDFDVAGVGSVIRIGGMNYLASQRGTVGTIIYRAQAGNYETSPATSSRFSIAEINGAEFGVRRTT